MESERQGGQGQEGGGGRGEGRVKRMRKRGERVEDKKGRGVMEEKRRRTGVRGAHGGFSICHYGA